MTKRLNIPEEVEQYFPVYGFYNVQSKKYNTKTKGQDEKKNKDILYSGSKKKKHTHTE
jgi:hypothetical protein